MTPRELAIVRSVIYASLFDYPLTLDQLHESLVDTSATADEVLQTYRSGRDLRRVVDFRDGFFFPAGRSDLVAERRRREGRSRAFLARHRRLLGLVCALPFTRLVALSGSIAHLNLEEGGDLDLFIVTRGQTVWTVTLAMVVSTRLLRRRRTLCANFVVSDEHLTLDQRDLFTANQVIHLKPLVGERVLEQFVAANPFVRQCYPNAGPGSHDFVLGRRPIADVVKRALERLLSPVAPAIETLCRRAYGSHLRRRAASWPSPEQVQLRADYLKLHSHSHRISVLDRYERAVTDALARAGQSTPRKLAETA
jgi:hypothetical protein